MSTSWQYNTSANMSNYGSVTVVPQTPVAPFSHTSNSQYGAWFGPGGGTGSRPVPGSGGGVRASSMRILGTVPSANDKYSSMKTNSVSAMMGHPVPDPKEKFSSLANKFGAGRILTPITSQYDMIMQEEEDSKPTRKESKTPIHSPEMGDGHHVAQVDITKITPGGENGYRKVMYKDDGLPPPQKDSYESALDGKSTVTPKLPGFERSQTLLTMATAQPHQSNVTPYEPASNKFSMGQRSNTFTADTPSSRFGRDMFQRDVVQKPLYPWRHEPHPPSAAPPQAPMTSTTSMTNPSSLASSAPTPGGPSSTVSLSDIQRAGADHVDSAGSQRSMNSSDSSGVASAASPYLESSTTTSVSNGMYWLYGSRARPPPSHNSRPNSYMFRMEQSQGQGHGNASGNFALSPEREASFFQRGPKPPTDLSPVTSPRGRTLPPSRSGSDYDLLRSSPADSFNPNGSSNFHDSLRFSSSDTKLDFGSSVGPSSNKKSILKKTSSYDTGFDFPFFSEPKFGSTMDNNRSLSSVSRGPTSSPVKLSTPGKRVTFKLTPRTREISPREENPRGYMNMFSGFRFDSSLAGYSEI